MSLQLKVFLDTNVLLKGFAAFKREQPLSRYLLDASAERYTFEKCVFEAYMAFRGIGGKKPDEGRGQWAEHHLRAATDPNGQLRNSKGVNKTLWKGEIYERTRKREIGTAGLREL